MNKAKILQHSVMVISKYGFDLLEETQYRRRQIVKTEPVMIDTEDITPENVDWLIERLQEELNRPYYKGHVEIPAKIKIRGIYGDRDMHYVIFGGR